MSTVSRQPDTSKLLAMVDNVTLREQVCTRAQHSNDEREQRRQYGRLSQSIHDLTETAEKFRKQAGQHQVEVSPP